MVEALCDYLLEKPHLYIDEMELFLLDEFNICAPKPTISERAKRHVLKAVNAVKEPKGERPLMLVGKGEVFSVSCYTRAKGC